MNITEIKESILEELITMNSENKNWLNTKELSKYLKVSITQLEIWRRESFGPSYLRLGKRRILYPKSAIADFIVSSQVKTL
ncbi:helix-turn-helix transcriptional regulator [Aliarcobacter thereius]|uniref:Helix-turn-helix domain-containing protein n=2 Tax=Aliarcobacter thereius TaxID=544718 RepID=A0A1C0B534_9BACT|nr:helix-turn-helix domain-containing protein [Aliarcobacter thereius]OCL95532.1 hypothetical protein AA347_00997 [Aliarcobacter thereius LMG 24486]OCL97566.1 hypothetical protein AAX29_01926 [Aliarcobacter thereius]QBF16481.1 DNA-binding protein [Aliarcobacter thereius LMG 24486]TLS72947.1 helix-turn-helix domain-containing protein [Aliarcobacter thereius]TLS91525.1 helix-turn-helix domain-containing protein [Aliarcobacter thereius]